LKREPGTFEVYEEPMPLVVEVWSPSTQKYDQTDKLPEYRLRSDQEVWFIHPYERTLTAWRKQPDGSYAETQHTEGSVQPAFLPNVTIELATLFD
jgi:Uma2 family endonuclease